MRITNKMLSATLNLNMQHNLERLSKSQTQISTGKSVIKASDAPSRISHLLSVKARIVNNEQYTFNIADGLSFLEQGDTAIGTIGKGLAQIKELTLQANNGTITPSDRDAISKQVDKLTDSLVDVANSTVGGKYIFAGTDNGFPPFKRNGDQITYRGNFEQVTREILPEASYEIGVPSVTLAALGKDGGSGELTEAGLNNLKSIEETAELIVRHNNIPLKITLTNTKTFISNISEPLATPNQLLHDLQNQLQSDINNAIQAYEGGGTGAGRQFPSITASMNNNHFDLIGNNIEVEKNDTFYVLTSNGEPGLLGVVSYDQKGSEAAGEKIYKLESGFFNTLFDLKNVLDTKNEESGGVSANLDSFIAKLGVEHDSVLAFHVKIGARTRHFESVKGQLEDLDVVLNQVVQDIEDADIARLSIDFSQQKLAYEASLATGAQILQTTLLNFLK